MNSKEIILNRIAGAAMPPVDYPAFDFPHSAAVRRSHGRLRRSRESGRRAGRRGRREPPFTELIRRYYPDAKTIASVLPEAHATINPDTVDDARKLIDIDLGVIDGCFGVAEKRRGMDPAGHPPQSLYFGATALMILILASAWSNTMHEALARPELDDFGLQLSWRSGPSKTARISNRPWSSGAHGD